MKKLTAFLLSILTVFFLALPAGAVSYQNGMDALRGQFKQGQSILDYVYYSPENAGSNGVKYPLVIWLHGNASGDYRGHQLDNCNIAMWSSDEYQRRVLGTKGMHILLPRCPTRTARIAWDDTYILPLKATIDSFISANKDSVDTSRIYIGGYSMGGKMVIRMASTYPEFFAAAFPLSPVYAPPTTELNRLKDMPIWFAWCKNDSYVSLNDLTVRSNWKYLMSVSSVAEKCRLSTFDTIYHPDGAIRLADGKNDIHNTWDPACYDFFMNNGAHFLDMEVTDGNGNSVTLQYPKGLIYWLSCQSLPEGGTETPETPEEPSDGQDEQNGQTNSNVLILLLNIINRILAIFKGFFK